MDARHLGCSSFLQIQLVKEGKPYVMFGDGTLAACKPISETDLASFIADCVTEVSIERCVPT
jgi:divinyl chlorophyllide a 8-vinyl-reductase